ncbi:MAG: transporter substrate-binding domain-containing protein [Gammaproteobacteria bacterium]
MQKRIIAWCAAGLIWIMGPLAAYAGDLQRILDEGVVRIGVPLDVPVYGFLDANQQPAGLDIDIANLVAKELGVKLEMQQITGINRIPYLVTNKVDIVISVMGATPERAKSIMFSSPYSSLYIGIFGPAKYAVEDPTKLGDLRIGVPRGTTQDIAISELHPEGNIIRFEDDATTVAAYVSGQVDVFGTANIVARALAEEHSDKEFQRVYRIRTSPAHMGVRHGETDLLRWLDTFIFYGKMSGTLDDLHRKWMGEPMASLPSF